MNAIKDSINKLFHWEYFPFIVFAFLMLMLHLGMKSYGDDLVYREVLRNQSLWMYITNAYEQWSSRIIIMPVAVFFAGQGFGLFSMADAVVYFLLPFIISKIFVSDHKWEHNWIIVFLLACVPFATMMSTAGWVVTSIHYLWPLTIGLVALYPLKKILLEESIKWYEYIIYFAALIFGINMEIMAAIIMTFYIAFSLFLICKKKLSWFLILGTIISIGNLVFILICPGNSVRELAEIATRFPDYIDLGVIQKISLSFTASLICIDQNFILLVITGMALVFSWHKDKMTRIVGVITFIFGLLVNLARVILMSPKFNGLLSKIEGVNITDWIDYNKLMNVVPGLYHYIILVGMMISSLFLMGLTFLLFKNSKKMWIAVMVMGAGIMSRVVMGFSATVYESGARTFLFEYVSFAIYGLLLYQEFKPELSGKTQRLLIQALCFFAIAGYLESFLRVLQLAS
ncbi:hypothetical protein AKG39_02660 [Acetobacterium bakii]|uniref:Uncharacterized protein n=1 Tax=Acetobacterium bakii TaxID=52689 RepID=A0A0L6U5K3_9FIRM|nr:DUF6056 family protein [Acetobacterium bakii]KNZ43075.1 hypothetical protein AKG39_02660 [Acetobacterium bakii]